MSERTNDMDISFFVAGRWQNGRGQIDLRTGQNRRQGDRRCADRRVGDRRSGERRG